MSLFRRHDMILCSLAGAPLNFQYSITAQLAKSHALSEHVHSKSYTKYTRESHKIAGNDGKLPVFVKVSINCTLSESFERILSAHRAQATTIVIYTVVI